VTSGSFEYQQAYLSARQREISARLFGLGVVSRLISALPREGAGNSLEGLNQLDKFVPYLAVRPDEHSASMLSLVAITLEDQEQRAFTHMNVGMLSPADILYPFDKVTPGDAEAVHDAARGLIQARDEGILPTLDPTLTSVQNPALLIIPALKT
jgi:hypothetical protein